MISRLMLSLKKAADTSEVGWSFRSISHKTRQLHDLEFVQISDEDTLSFAEEETPLETVPSTISVSVTGTIQVAAAIS